LDEREYHRLADAALNEIETRLEAAEVDFERVSESIIEIELERSRIIINKQAAMQEIWLAAKSGGFHYRYVAEDHGGRWLDTRSGEELFGALARLIA
jgi:CyaY protein